MGDSAQQAKELAQLKSKLASLKKHATPAQQKTIELLEIRIAELEKAPIQPPTKEVLELLGKANKTVKQVNGTIKALEDLQKSINKLAEFSVREGKDKEREIDRYHQMVEHISSFVSALKDLKENLDGLANIKDSKITGALSKSADVLSKTTKALDAVAYLTDQRKVDAFIANPESYDAAKAWARHTADGFNKLAAIVDAIPVPDGPLRGMKFYFTSILQTGPKIVDAYIKIVDMRLEKIDKATGGAVRFRSDDPKHYVNNKNEDGEYEFQGAFLPLYGASVVEAAAFKQLLKDNREMLVDYKTSAQYRAQQLAQLIVKSGESDEVQQAWIKLLKDQFPKIKQMAKKETHGYLGYDY